MDDFDATGRFTSVQGADPRLRRLDGAELLTRMHREATSSILDLLDSFFVNAEDALFELAYRSSDNSEQQQCFDLMRQMRERRSTVVQVFSSMLQRAGTAWLTGTQLASSDDEEIRAMRLQAQRIGDKCSAHFGLLLELTRQRTTKLTPRPLPSIEDMPLSPAAVARSFLAGLEAMHLEAHAEQQVVTLFERFVMDRLGPVYGACHVLLVHAGVPADEENSVGESLESIGESGSGGSQGRLQDLVPC